MRSICFLLIALLTLRSSHAQAGDDRAIGIVLESYTVAKPDTANRLVSPVLDELSSRGFVAGAAVVGRKLEAGTSRASRSPEGLPTDFGEQAERGHKAWIAGKFDEAMQILGPLVEAARANASAFVQNQALRDKLRIALIALALSQQRAGQSAASRETLREILRSFPSYEVSRGAYGPDAYELFDQVRKQASAQGRGRLVVKTTNESSVVFLNETFIDVGSSTRGDLVPGEYRVLAQVGKQMSRTHVVVVKANEEVTVTIDAAFDAAVHNSPSWTGLAFATAADRERLEARYAANFANAVEARAVAVIGIVEMKGRPVLVGSLVNVVNGREIRRATLALDPDPPVDRLRAMARFLAGDQPIAGLEVQLAGKASAGSEDPSRAGDQGDDARRAHAWRGWKWLTGGAATMALATGGVMIAIDGSCSDQVSSGLGCLKRFDTAVPGWFVAGGGALLAVTTIYLVVHGRQSPRLTALLVPVPGGAFASFATRF